MTEGRNFLKRRIKNKQNLCNMYVCFRVVDVIHTATLTLIKEKSVHVTVQITTLDLFKEMIALIIFELEIFIYSKRWQS